MIWRRSLKFTVILFFIGCGLVIYFTAQGRLISHGDILTRGIEGKQLSKDAHLLTIVALPKKKLEIDVARTIYEAWRTGNLALGHYKFAVTTKTNKNNPSHHLFLPTDCSDLTLDDPKQLYCLLKAIYYTSSDEYKWFFITSEVVYPLVENIRHTLIGLNSDTFLYIGEQLQDHSSDQKYCSLKSGLLLSRKALQTVVEQLESCLLSGTSGAGDVVLGKCIATAVHQQCTKKNEVSACS